MGEGGLISFNERNTFGYTVLYDGTQPEILKLDMSWDILLLNLYLTNLLDYKAWQLIKKIHPFRFFYYFYF